MEPLKKAGKMFLNIANSLKRIFCAHVQVIFLSGPPAYFVRTGYNFILPLSDHMGVHAEFCITDLSNFNQPLDRNQKCG